MTTEDYDWIGDWSGKRAMLTPKNEVFYDNIEKRRYTYSDVDSRANQLPRVLLNRGIRKGDRVEVVAKTDEKEKVTLKTTCTNQSGTGVLDGEATVGLMKLEDE